MSSGLEACRVEELLGRLNEVEQKYAPQTLFVAGDREILTVGARVAMVGSRAASGGGLARARKLARLLAARGVVVVSGLAKGIDTAAHRATIEAGGKTVAVIGTPLDKAYPRENTALQAEVMQHHLCLSPFPEGQPVRRQNFLLRNRTIALISDASVVIEAGEGSGSVQEAKAALQLGRPVFILRSMVADSTRQWPTKLVAQGASVLGDDTIESLFDRLPQRGSE